MLFRSTILLATASPLVLGQQVKADKIGTCKTVNCPPREGDYNGVACRVTNHTFNMIGVKSLPNAITGDGDGDDLTWTVGTQVFDRTDPSNSSVRIVEKDFYLGTPPSLNLRSDDLPYQGCAIIISGNARTGPEHGSQSCDTVIGSECKQDLLKDAESWLKSRQNHTEPTEVVCERLQQALNGKFTKACSDVAFEDKWATIKGVALTGDSAISPPDSSANASSTCHPTLPKSNDLSFAFGFNETGDLYADSTRRILSGVNLILTMFWSPDKQVQGALEAPASHLTCLWPIFETSQGFRGGSGSGSTKPNGAAENMLRSSSKAGLFVFVVCFFLLM